jgi:hypothetical protein
MKILSFFLFLGSFLPSWIRIRIRNLYADPDPAAHINAAPCGSGYGSGSETLIKTNADPQHWVKLFRIRIRQSQTVVPVSSPTGSAYTWLPGQGRTFSGLVDLVGLAGLVWDGSGGGRTYRRLGADEMRGTMTHAWEQALQVPACFSYHVGFILVLVVVLPMAPLGPIGKCLCTVSPHLRHISILILLQVGGTSPAL